MVNILIRMVLLTCTLAELSRPRPIVENQKAVRKILIKIVASWKNSNEWPSINQTFYESETLLRLLSFEASLNDLSSTTHKPTGKVHLQNVIIRLRILSELLALLLNQHSRFYETHDESAPSSPFLCKKKTNKRNRGK